MEVTKALKAVADLPHVIIGDMPTLNYFAGAQSLVTMNSAVGFEALMHAVPVISCARSEYQNCTLQAKDVATLENQLDRVQDHTPDCRAILAFS